MLVRRGAIQLNATSAFLTIVVLYCRIVVKWHGVARRRGTTVDEQFFAHHDDIGRRGNAQFDAVALDAEDRDLDDAAEDD